MISLLRYYNWKKFSIIAEDEWETVAKSLQLQASQNNFTVNHYKIVADRHECCIKNTDCCQNGFWYQLIHSTKNGTRSKFSFLYYSLLSKSILRVGQILRSVVCIKKTYFVSYIRHCFNMWFDCCSLGQACTNRAKLLLTKKFWFGVAQTAFSKKVFAFAVNKNDFS